MCNCLFCLTSGGARCCAIWSFVSVVWLIVVGIVMSSTPVYVKDMTDAQAGNAKTNAFAAAGMYIATLVVAIVMYYYRLRQEGRVQFSRINNDDVDLSAPLVADESSRKRPAVAGGKARSRETESNGGSSTATTTI